MVRCRCRAHVAAFLAELDLSTFNPKAPPLKTPAFWQIVDSQRGPEDSELEDAIERMGSPDVLTLDDLRAIALGTFAEWLNDRKNARAIPHRLEEAGYVAVRNPLDKNKVIGKLAAGVNPSMLQHVCHRVNEISAARRLIAVKGD